MLPIPDLPNLPDLPLPSLPDLLPFPLPGLEEPLFTVALVVAGIGFFFEGVMMFWEVALPENNRQRVRYAILATPAVGMFALDYATGSVLGVLFWAGMYGFDAVRLRFDLSRREAITNIVLWLRRQFGNLGQQGR